MGDSYCFMIDNQYNTNLSWMDEKVTKMDSHKFFYWIVRLVTFRLRKKLTYKELFLLYYGLHRNRLGEHMSKQKALETVIKVYTENNGKKPEML